MYIYLVVYIVCHIAGTGYADIIVKNTTLGDIVGRVRNVSGIVEEYLGIPYAAPPVGDLRWKAPAPYPPGRDKEEVWNATYPRSQCPQNSSSGNVTGNEDCLYLNVYVPSKSTSELYPVMIFFHPGSFQTDNGSAYDGALLSDQKGVIIVTFNYRLGALGFLNTGDNHATGNYGLLDQKAVLEWVQDNIANFQGDPDSVSIFGAAAGAVSTLLHAISPQTQSTKKLFHRVISQSGSPFSWWGFQTNPKYYATKIINETGCLNSTMQSAMECMRTLTAHDIVKAQLEVEGNQFGPTADGDYITDIPDVMVTDMDLISNLQGRYEYLIGVNDFETGWDYQHIEEVEDKEGFVKFLRLRLREHFEDYVKMADIVSLNYIDPVNPPSTALEWKHLSFNVSRDFMFLAPSVNMTWLASSDDGFNSTSYFYLFSHKPSQALVDAGEGMCGNTSVIDWYFQATMQILTAFPSNDTVDGATHKDEIAYVFGVPFSLEGATDLDRQISDQMMTRWTNFAKNGNPSREGDSEAMWPEFEWETQRFLQFGGEAVTENVTRVGAHLQSSEVIFWTRELEFFGEGKGFDDSVGTTINSGETTTISPNNICVTEVTTEATTESCVCTAIGTALGLSLAPEQADVVIYTLFVVSLVLATTLLIAMLRWCWCSSEKSKNRDLLIENHYTSDGTLAGMEMYNSVTLEGHDSKSGQITAL